MSQSDYIHYKKISNELKFMSKLSPVLNAGDYTNFLSFSIENQIRSTKQANSQLALPNQVIINDISTIDVSGCPVFKTCIDTNERPNRVLRVNNATYFRPLRPLTQKQIDAIANADDCLCYNK
jgi:hypothetical protein